MARATSLAFLTPVWQRFSLTEICLLQRRHACDYLKEHHGLDATCIVIGSDENLEIAESFGFIGQHHENLAVAAHVNRGEPYVCLGMKFNAGYGRAYEEGIDLVFPIGSDSWIDPIYFSELPEPGELLLSRAYNLVTPDAQRRGALWIGWEGGVQWISWTKDWLHRRRHTGVFEVVSPDLSKGCDTSTWVHKHQEIRVGEHHHHQLEYVAFQSPSNQITDYAHIMSKYGVGEVQGEAVFADLQDHYAAADILAMRRHYNAERIRLIEETLGLMEEEMTETRRALVDLYDEQKELAHAGQGK